STAHGWSSKRRRRFEPWAIAPQKNAVVLVPRAPPAGTATLRSRQPVAQRNGSVHCVFRFGPVGPLKNAVCSSPQRPWNAIQGNDRRAAVASLGIVSTTGRTSDGRRRVGSAAPP